MALCLAVSALAVPAWADEPIGDETPSTKCEHGNDPATCTQCNPPEPQKCEHGNDPATCTQCNPPEPQKCEHGKIPSECTVCNPPKCPHGKIPSECTVCNPPKCPHGKIPSECTVCNPPKCPHGKIPSECTVCNPSEVGKPTSSDFSYPSSVNFGTLEKNASSSSRTQTFTIKNKSDYEMKLS